MKRTRKTAKRNIHASNAASKQDILNLSTKIDRNQKALDQLDDVGRILRENEQNLKDLKGLQNRLNALDKIMVTVDKIAGSIQTYQQVQILHSNSLSSHEDRLEKSENTFIYRRPFKK